MSPKTTEPTDPKAAEADAAKAAEATAKDADAKREAEAKRHADDPEYHAHVLTADEIAYLRKNVLV